MAFRFKRGDSVTLNGPGSLANISGIVVARVSSMLTDNVAYYVKTADYFPIRVNECYLDAGRIRAPVRVVPAAPVAAFVRAMTSLTHATTALRKAEDGNDFELINSAAANVLAIAYEPMYRFACLHRDSPINVATMETVQWTIRHYGSTHIDARLNALPFCVRCGCDGELAVMVPCGCIAHTACVENGTCMCGVSVQSTVVSPHLNRCIATMRSILDADLASLMDDSPAALI